MFPEISFVICGGVVALWYASKPNDFKAFGLGRAIVLFIGVIYGSVFGMKNLSIQNLLTLFVAAMTVFFLVLLISRKFFNRAKF